MKRIIVFCLLVTYAFVSRAQSKFPPVDRSPMDMSYCPTDYPILRIQNKATEPLVARIIYGRPQKNDRVIFGDLVPYGSVWRLGANEATEIEFFKDVKIDGKKVSKGRYTLYAMPDTDKWTLILNTEVNIWGAFNYDSKKDVTRIDVPVQKQTDLTEVFTMLFEKTSSNSSNLIIAWDNVMVKLPFKW